MKDSVVWFFLKLFVILTYIISHIYDYISIPFFYLYYRTWRVRRYKRNIHARREDVSDSEVVFHSLAEPGPYNIIISRYNLDTMEKVFDYAAREYGTSDALGTREILREEDEVQPNGKVFKKLVLGQYNWINFKETVERAKVLGAGLRVAGLKSGDRLAVLAETRADWMTTAIACFKNNFAIVTLYTNLGMDGVTHGINETEVEFLVCSYETLPKAKEAMEKCPTLKTLLIMESLTPGAKKLEQSDFKGGNFIMYDDLVRKGKIELEKDPRESTRSPPVPNDVAIVMYTSGSTGNPKGVMLSHKNLIASMGGVINVAPFRPRKDRYIGYLPLAHVLELLAETSCLLHGIKIGYSSAGTLTNKSTKVKAGSKGDANLLKPTLMCAVPMILERIYKSTVDTMRRQGWAVEELFHYFVNYKMKWQDRGFDTPLLKKTLFRKIRYFLGGKVRFMLSGGAPLSEDTHSLTRTCICVPLMQGYGLTETTACATVTSVHDRTTGRVGAPLLGIRIKLVNWDEGNYRVTDKPYPRGEIHVGGDNVALGYFKQAAKTAEEFYEEDGMRWFKTGDIGEVQDDGVVKIVDRKKDLVKLQHGEYISYGKVEAILKTCPIVESICLYGDSSKTYVVAVVVPDREKLKKLSGCEKPEVALNDPEVLKKILGQMATHGKDQGLEKVELPQKIVATLDEWNPDNGLVTAAFKIRRRQIIEKYQKEIEDLYQ